MSKKRISFRQGSVIETWRETRLDKFSCIHLSKFQSLSMCTISTQIIEWRTVVHAYQACIRICIWRISRSSLHNHSRAKSWITKGYADFMSQATNTEFQHEALQTSQANYRCAADRQNHGWTIDKSIYVIFEKQYRCTRCGSPPSSLAPPPPKKKTGSKSFLA